MKPNKLQNDREIATIIGFMLKEIAKKNNLKQIDWATKISKNTWKEVTQWNLNSYLNGIRTSPNIEYYWTFAEAIPISRWRFDEIVEQAKTEVLWFPEKNSETKNPDEQIQIALNSKGFSEKEILEMMDFIKFKESQK